jgi:hypothetical protein
MSAVERSPLRLSEGLVVAAVPAYGYLLAYLYRRGFADELRIPLEFIRVELSDVLVMTVGGLAIGTFLLPFLHIAISIPEVLPNDRRWRLAYCLGLIWLVISGVQFVIYRNHLERVWSSAIWIGVIALSALWSAWSGPPPTIGIFRIGERVAAKATMVSALVLLMAAINVHAAGAARALDQRQYLVLPSTDEAVLAIYGQTAVLAPHSDSQLRDRFRLVDVTGLELERREIGPLRPPPERK